MNNTESRLVGRKLLRCGYTTGSCAAAASKAAVFMLLTGQRCEKITITTPKGQSLSLDITDIDMSADYISCAVRKDSGDDPDVTNGVLVYSRAERVPVGIEIRGGRGVGRVTRPGLDQPVGEAAINSVPRKMIHDGALEAIALSGGSYTGGLRLTISIPDGERLAEKTFNPRMGIVGGISVLGTTGIVEPMSDLALADSIRTEIRMLAARGNDRILITLGNYGADFCADVLGLDLEDSIMCSNFIDTALDASVECGFRHIMLVGHIGKLVKLGIGMFNTHSHNGDGRIETMVMCALQAGASLETLRDISGCVTTDAVIAVLDRDGLTDRTFEILQEKILFNISRRIPDETESGFLCFTNKAEDARILMKSGNADRLIEEWREK